MSDRHALGVLAAEATDLGDAAREQLRVLVRERDRSSGGQPGVGPGGGPRPEHPDAFAHAAGGAVERALHPLAERKEQHDRERAPADGHHGEADPLAVAGGVGPEKAPDESQLGGAHARLDHVDVVRKSGNGMHIGHGVRVSGIMLRLDGENSRIQILPVRNLALVQLSVNTRAELAGQEVGCRDHEIVAGIAGQEFGL